VGEAMNIEEYADAINVEIRIARRCNRQPSWFANFERCEILDDGFIRGALGMGRTPDEAIEAYVKEIRGKKIVINSVDFITERRREFVVPDTLTGRPK
jgi:hypothetical protein